MIQFRPDAPSVRAATTTPTQAPRTADVQSPYDTFQPSATPAGATPPAPDMRAAAPPSRGVGGFVLGVAATLAVVGIAGVIIGQQAPPPPPNGQISVPPGLTVEQAQSEFDALRYLDDLAAPAGGGLSRSLLGVIPQQVTPQKALDELARGNEITFKESRSATPHAIHSFQELNDLRDQVREQQVKNAINHGIDQIQQGIDQLGNAIRDGAQQIQDGWNNSTRPRQ